MAGKGTSFTRANLGRRELRLQPLRFRDFLHVAASQSISLKPMLAYFCKFFTRIDAKGIISWTLSYSYPITFICFSLWRSM